MTRISRRDFGVSVGALAVSTFTFGKGRATSQSQLEGYPIASDVSTTLRRTVVPGPTPSAKFSFMSFRNTSNTASATGRLAILSNPSRGPISCRRVTAVQQSPKKQNC